MKKKGKLKRYEYQEIYERYFERDYGIRELSRYLGRNASTISRALKRDFHPSPCLTTYEKAMYAYEKSRERMNSGRCRKRLKTERIRKLVIWLLIRKHWSPEAISDFLERHELKISGKAIYNFIKKEREDLKQYLYQRGKVRRQRVSHPRGVFKSGVPKKKSIHIRPRVIGPGHWEIDTVLSNRSGKGGVLTLRELDTKKTYYFLLKNLRAKTTMNVLLPFFQSLPKSLCKTLTSDNGAEFSELYKLEKVIPGFSVYYCDPYKAYQRGSVENANGELRWYFPKKTDFSLVTTKELRSAEFKINAKPRRANNKRSASFAFKQLLKKAA